MENKNWLKKLIKGKKKAFTLIELLAIIVILAIIAVITVPIILNIIENAKKGAATNSAYGYKDAIQKFYASKLSLDSTYNIPDGLHTKADFDTMGVLINGKAPASNSFLKTYKNVVTQGCLQFDEYKVEFVDGKPTSTTKGTCKTVNIVYTDVDDSKTINLGDTVKIENEEFTIIDAPKDGHVKLLSKYNLDSNSRQASSGFVGNDYSDTYITNYTNYLRELGAYFVVDGRRLKYTEAMATGCNSTCPDFVVNQPYRLENDSGQPGTRSIASNWKSVTDSVYDGTGMRALIIIYESAIVDQYTIAFDSRGGTEVASRTIVPGNKVGDLPTSTKGTAQLEGWYTDTSYTTKINADTIPPGSSTYYAKWVMTKVDYYSDINNSGTIDMGDIVRIYNDEFTIIDVPKNGQVKLLSKYNLDSNSRQASSGYVANDYSDTYITNYTNYLLEQGAGYIVEGRRLKYTEAMATGCNSACPDFVVNQPYRLENDSGGAGTRSIASNWRQVTDSVYDGTGMRALIVINESALVDQYTITFDSRGGTSAETRQITIGNTLGALPEPTKSNSELEGWYWDAEYTTKVSADTVPIGSGTLYAKWIMTKVTSFTDADGSGTITLGDNVKIYDDDFYVIAEPSDNKVKLLSKYNLSSNSRQVSSNYVVNNFSDTYIENYTDYLLGQGAGYIVEGRKMKYTEAVATGCNSACPDFVVNQPYRLENDSGQSGTRSITAYWKEITSSNYDGTGMRALIVINESAITIPTN